MLCVDKSRGLGEKGEERDKMKSHFFSLQSMCIIRQISMNKSMCNPVYFMRKIPEIIKSMYA